MRLSSYVPGVHYLSRRTNIEEGRGAQDLVGRVTGCENERSTFRWRVGMASSLRSRGGGSGRRVFINGIRGIIDGVSRVGQAGVCPRERGKEEVHFPSIHDGPTRRILSISSIDRVVGFTRPVYRIYYSRPHLVLRYKTRLRALRRLFSFRSTIVLCTYIYISRPVSFIESIFLFNVSFLSFIISYEC